MLRIVSSFALLALLMGHDHPGCGGADGVPTGAECDPRVRWDTFGKDFMAAYCTSCHASELRGGARRGAPEDHDYDTHAGVQVDPSHIDLAAGAGPAGANDVMPPYGPIPTLEERQQLARWLACGAP
jgi:uncharacterized membrane protein